MVLLFRTGDFYEAFLDDATLITQVLGLTLTTRDKVPMAGFPHHALQPHLQKLLQAGHRVAICDQVEDAFQEVTRVVTEKGGPMISTAKFSLGKVLATPGAMRAMEESGQEAAFFLDRHATGNWGQVCQEDAQLNDEALKDGGRILSAYSTLRGVKIWIITEAADDHGHRAATTIMLPDEY